MARKWFTAEQIIMKLREAEVGLAQGKTVGQVSKQIGVSEQTYYRWRKEYGGLRIDQAKRLKTLEKENARLKKRVPDLSWDKQILKEVASGNFRPGEKETRSGVGTREIRSKASFRTSGLSSAGAGSQVISKQGQSPNRGSRSHFAVCHLILPAGRGSATTAPQLAGSSAAPPAWRCPRPAGWPRSQGASETAAGRSDDAPPNNGGPDPPVSG